ncbi:MAG: hypothetical protein KAG64_00085 [Bacteroidales bacterium]|nr:hypothetical protein [Bacteroidales bacterium]
MKRTLQILTIVFGLFLITSTTAKAQMDCRSMLGAHLTSFKKDGALSWAIEGTMAPGLMTSPFPQKEKTMLNGGMMLGALDFQFKKKNHFYIEGGYKNWKNSEFVDDTMSSSRHIGIRQLFYSYSSDNTKIKIGLHETRLGDFFLIDERMVGLSVDHSIGAFSLNFRLGSVNQNFARMGKFCANRHLYGILNPDYTEKIGKSLGETNLTGFVINWDPHFTKTVENKTEDEFETTDEFHVNHDFNEFGSSEEFSEENDTEDNNKAKPFFVIKNIGLIFYDEFGSEKYIPDNKFYTGLLVDIGLPFGFFMQTGGVYQNMKDNDAIVYIAKLGNSKTWGNASNTKLSVAYIGKYNIDNNAIFQPLFSNLFIGEVMRMDAPDFPIWQVALKHRFPGKLKLHVAVKAVGQIELAKTNEQDLEVGIKLFNNHIKMTGILSHVSSNAIPNDFIMARLEVRVAF